MLIPLAFALRIYRLGVQSIWWDEGFSVQLARLSVPEAVRFTARDIHPPLYYILLHYWVSLTSDTEFSLRFLSLVFGVLLVACAYAFSRRFFDGRTALLAAALVTFAPLEVIYSQEARMYTLLTLEYLAILWVFYLLIGEGRRLSWKEWTVLIIVEAASLYTHYFGVLIIGSVNLIAAAYLAFGRRWRDLGRWIGAQVLALALYIPWMWVATRQLVAYVPKWAEPLNLGDFARVMWHFSIVGTAQVIGHHTAAIRASIALGLALLVALPLALAADRRRGRTVSLLLHLLVPAVVTFAMDRVRSGVHPRYLMVFYLAFLLFLGRVIASLVAEGPPALKPVGAALGAAFIAVSAVGLRINYFDEAYHKDDVRSVARYLEERAGEKDVIISDYDDLPCFRYYYHGSTATSFLKMEGPELPLITRLQQATQDKGRAFLVKWIRGQSDRRDIIPFIMELGGRLTEKRQFLGMDLLTYELETSPPLPILNPTFANFGLFQLTGAFFEGATPADDAIAVSLRWKMMARTAKEYKAAVSLWDEGGHFIAGADSFLLDEACYVTKRWAPSTEFTNFYVLPIPPGTPPLSYTLKVGVYEEKHLEGLDLLSEAGAPSGKHFRLGEVRLTRPRALPARSSYRFAQVGPSQAVGKEVAKGLVLEDLSLTRQALSPGEGLGVRLRWRAAQGGLPEYSPEIRIIQEGKVIASTSGAPSYGRYPTSLWSAGEEVLDWRDLTLDSQAREGGARLELKVGDGDWRPLVELRVKGLERAYAVPSMQYRLGVRFGDVAELLGYDLSSTEVTAKDGLDLTLYWRALRREAPPIGYTVFVHLLSPEVRVVAQHDSPPAGGLRPTTGWVQGEVIADRHHLEFREPDFQGQGSLEIGLYDPATGKRLTLENGQDHLILPTPMTVRPKG